MLFTRDEPETYRQRLKVKERKTLSFPAGVAL